MQLLTCTIQPYAWGSRTALAELTGRPGPTGPEAELWMGAHPVAPSRIESSPEETLLDRIEAAPEPTLGAPVVQRYGARLPYLLKVLAAAQPLSLQAHPSVEQARAGFDDEERRGVPRDAPTRNYKDASAKPELLCALGPFEALCGFRDPIATADLFDALVHLGATSLEPTVRALRGSDPAAALRQAFEGLMTLPRPAAASVAADALAAAARYEGPFARECGWARQLGELYPGDVGAVTALLLHHVELSAGEAIYLDAGNLHAYLRGTAVEIMASSDNVLRGGLTPKHVDVPELLRVLDFRPHRVDKLAPRPAGPHERAYVTPAPDFRLSRIELSARESARPLRRGPEILLSVRGSMLLECGRAAVPLAQGTAVFIAASDGEYVLSGEGTAFRATVGGD